MWLQHPRDKSVCHQLSERTEGGMIAAFVAQGYIEVQPCYMRSPAGDVFFVDHPAHQQRLYAEMGYVVVDGPTPTETSAPPPVAPPVLAARAKK